MWDRSIHRDSLIPFVSGIAFILSACGEAPEVSAASSKGVPRTPVRVEIVKARLEAPRLSVPGIVEARSRISLRFRVGGFVEAFLVEEGERVERGAIIAELDKSDLEREVRAARAQAERTRVRADETQQVFERQAALLESSSTSQQNHDRARFARDGARAEAVVAAVDLEEATDRLGKATLRAPVSGYIERKLIEAHELANPETPVLVLTQLDRVTIRAAVSDSYARNLKVGSPVVVRTPLWPDREFEGLVQRIDVSADPSTRTIPFEVELPNPDLALRPELMVEVDLSAGAPEPVTDVPLAAVLRDVANQPFCFVVIGESEQSTVVERRVVSLGAVSGDRVAVSGGVETGDRVVVRGQQFLRPGDSVRVVSE